MKAALLKSIAAITALATLPISLQLVAQDVQAPNTSPIHYSVVNLGTLGGTVSAAYGINNKGWVTGDANLQGDQNEHGFVWRKGIKIDLGTFGGPNSASSPPNDSGVVVGAAQTSEKDPLGEQFLGYFCGNNPCSGVDHISLPFHWQDGVMTALPTLGGNNGQAFGVNNRSQVVGVAENTTVDQTCIAPQVLDFEAVVWRPEAGEVQELPAFPGDTIGAAVAINDKGQVVGCSGTCGSVSPAVCVHAMLWQNSSAIDLGSLGGVMNNLAATINNRGQVAGLSDLAGDATAHAFLWTEDNGLQDLGTLPGDVLSLSSGMNNKGQIVGQSCDVNGKCSAFLWESGVMTDLNKLIPSGSSLSLIYGADINDRGEIAGQAYDPNTGETPAFLAIPCDDAHASYEGCADGTAGPAAAAQAVSERPRVILPERVREQLQKRRGFGRFAGGPVTPQ
jgi:probable HAF family extracellular repeat protein